MMKTKSIFVVSLGCLLLLSIFTIAKAQLDDGSSGATQVYLPIIVAQDTEQQISITQAVESYFAWQYNILSANTDEATARNVVSTVGLEEARIFFQSKLDQFEVISYSNQLTGASIPQSYRLEFRAITVNDDHAIVEVDAIENMEQESVSSIEKTIAHGINHRIKLGRNGETWEIVEDVILNATDAFPLVFDKEALKKEISETVALRQESEQEMLMAAGITPEFLTERRESLVQQGLSEQQVDEQLTIIVNEIMDRDALTRDSSHKASESASGILSPLTNTNRGYDRNAAKAYIDSWWNKRNPSWGDFDSLGGDCTNYASQVINAGGIPEDKTGSYQWYWDNMQPPRTSSPYTRSPSWGGVNEFWTYIQGNSNNNGPNGPQGQWWTTSSGHTQMQTGDVIQLSNGSRWFHTYVVHHTQWKTKNGRTSYKVYVSSHNSNRQQDDIDAVASAYPTRRYIRILGWYQQ